MNLSNHFNLHLPAVCTWVCCCYHVVIVCVCVRMILIGPRAATVKMAALSRRLCIVWPHS